MELRLVVGLGLVVAPVCSGCPCKIGAVVLLEVTPPSSFYALSVEIRYSVTTARVRPVVVGLQVFRALLEREEEALPKAGKRPLGAATREKENCY